MDTLQLRDMLCWAGIDIGEENAYLLQKSLRDLARKKDGSNVRLFGKIACSERDYWIAEAEKAIIDEYEKPEHAEDRNAQLSTNNFSYWVT